MSESKHHLQAYMQLKNELERQAEWDLQASIRREVKNNCTKNFKAANHVHVCEANRNLQIYIDHVHVREANRNLQIYMQRRDEHERESEWIRYASIIREVKDNNTRS